MSYHLCTTPLINKCFKYFIEVFTLNFIRTEAGFLTEEWDCVEGHLWSGREREWSIFVKKRKDKRHVLMSPYATFVWVSVKGMSHYTKHHVNPQTFSGFHNGSCENPKEPTSSLIPSTILLTKFVSISFSTTKVSIFIFTYPSYYFSSMNVYL